MAVYLFAAFFLTSALAAYQGLNGYNATVFRSGASFDGMTYDDQGFLWYTGFSDHCLHRVNLTSNASKTNCNCLWYGVVFTQHRLFATCNNSVCEVNPSDLTLAKVTNTFPNGKPGAFEDLMVDPVSHDIFVVAENRAIYRFTPPAPGSTTTLRLYFNLSHYTLSMDGFAIGCDGTLYVAYKDAILVISKSSVTPSTIYNISLSAALCDRPDGIAVSLDHLLMACAEQTVLLSLTPPYSTLVVARAPSKNTGDEVYVGQDGCAYVAYDDMVKISPCHFCNTEHLLILLSQDSDTSTCRGPATFTATANDNTATGTVTFFADQTNLGSKAFTNGVASITTSVLTAGTYAITAVYHPTSGPSILIQDVLNHTVIRFGPDIKIAQNAARTSTGGSVTFTATLTDRGADAFSGVINFYNGTDLIGSPVMSNGVATLTISDLPGGNDTIKATYPGDNCYRGVSAQLFHIVAPLTITLSQKPLTSTCKGPATFTATANDVSLTGGNVSFFTDDGTRLLGSSPFKAGVASVTTSVLLAGEYNVTATYQPGSGLVAIDGVLLHTVIRYAPKLQLTQSSPSSASGDPVTFTASVIGRAGDTFTGPIEFFDGAASLGQRDMTNHVAKLTTSNLKEGNRTIKATYPGTTCYKGVSSQLHHIIETLVITLSQKPQSTTCKSPATFTATASDPSTKGTVTFYTGSTSLGTATFTNGVAHSTTSVLEAGDYEITAKYKSPTDPIVAIQDTLQHTVTRYPPKIKITQSSPDSDFGFPVTFTATITARSTDTLSGPIKFLDGAKILGTPDMTNRVAKLTTSNLPIGNRTIKATYPGNTCLKGVSAQLHHIVHQHDRFATWGSASSGTLNGDTFHIAYDPLNQANSSVVPESWTQSPDYSFAPDTAVKETAISVANNVAVTVTFPALTETPLLYIKIWTIGTYIFSEDFDVKSSNGNFFTKSTQADGTIKFVVSKGLNGILEFATSVTKIQWSATPKSDVRQIYFTLAIPV